MACWFSNPWGVPWTHHKGEFLKCFLLITALPHNDNFWQKNTVDWMFIVIVVEFYSVLTWIETKGCLERRKKSNTKTDGALENGPQCKAGQYVICVKHANPQYGPLVWCGAVWVWFVLLSAQLWQRLQKRPSSYLCSLTLTAGNSRNKPLKQTRQGKFILQVS